MKPEDSIRYLDHQAKQCRGRDAGEALCLLLPAIMRILDLEPMEDIEAAAFRHGFKRDLDALPDRLAGRQEAPAGTRARPSACYCRP
jgi:hypothetical protein